MKDEIGFAALPFEVREMVIMACLLSPTFSGSRIGLRSNLQHIKPPWHNAAANLCRMAWNKMIYEEAQVLVYGNAVWRTFLTPNGHRFCSGIAEACHCHGGSDNRIHLQQTIRAEVMQRHRHHEVWFNDVALFPTSEWPKLVTQIKAFVSCLAAAPVVESISIGWQTSHHLRRLLHKPPSCKHYDLLLEPFRDLRVSKVNIESPLKPQYGATLGSSQDAPTAGVTLSQDMLLALSLQDDEYEDYLSFVGQLETDMRGLQQRAGWIPTVTIQEAQGT